MPRVDGPILYRELQRELDAARRNRAMLEGDLDRMDAEMKELVERRGEALAELAREILPDLTRKSVEKTLGEVRDELRGVLASKERRAGELRETIAETETARERFDAELEDLTRTLDEVTARRETQEALVARHLEADEEFQRLSRAVLEAERSLSRDEGRVRDIQAEAAEKLPSYGQNRFFKYLFDRGYGTPEYRSRGLLKRLDGWLAGLIDYGKARRSYQFLRKMPELMDIEASRRRENFEALMQEVEDIEDQVSDEVGLTEALREVERIAAKREAAVAALKQKNQRLAGLNAELQAISRSRGRFYEQALGRLQSRLQSTKESVLERRARATPGEEDDRLVAEIAGMNEALESARGRVRELLKEQETAQEVYRGLEDVVSRYRARGYESQRSYFAAGFDPMEHVSRFRNGKITRTALWSRLSRNQRFRSPEPPPQYAPAGTHAAPGQSGVGPALLGAMVQVVGPALAQMANHALTRRGSAGQRRRVRQGRPRTDWELFGG